MAQLISTKQHTARKEHKCDYCWQKINIGTVYKSDFLVYEGKSYTWKSHDYCNKIIDKLDMGKLARDNNEEGITEEFFTQCIDKEYKRLEDEKLITFSAIKFNWNARYDVVLLFHDLKS